MSTVGWLEGKVEVADERQVDANVRSADTFFPVASDAVRMCSGPCGEVKASTSFPTVSGAPGARHGECRACRDERLRSAKSAAPALAEGWAKNIPAGGRRDKVRAQRQAVGETVVEVVTAHSGYAVTISQVYEEVFDRLQFVPAEADVRNCLRELVKADDRCVKVGRDTYAWCSDGVIPPPPAPPHVADMIARRWRGQTLDEIGAVHGVTRERIRQLLKKYGGPSSTEVRRIQVQQAEAAEEARRETAANEIRRFLSGHGAATVDDVAGATGLDTGDVSKFWPPDLMHLRLWGSGNFESRWSDEEILDVIREAAIYEFPLTANAYGDLLAVGQVTGPSLARIGQRFGSWVAACDAAGVVSGQATRPHYESQWGDQDILSIVRQYLEDPTAPNSIQGFDVWRRTNAPDGPSGQTIRNRFRSWTEVKRIALTRRPTAQEEHIDE